MTSATRRLAVRFDEAVWREAIRGFSREPLHIAASARLAAERRGVALAEVLPCEAAGPEGRGSPAARNCTCRLPTHRPRSDRSRSFCGWPGRPTARSCGSSLPSATAIRGPACAASTSARTASSTADFPSDSGRPVVAIEVAICRNLSSRHLTQMTL